ncbi:globin family protein [Wenyingzhuangia sp. 2_MG-2023]|uniref:globin family protein n=1 Tax=Wenyingzhuangia sp. 2_MG-2023 TaxID=3062639 RepID=UPI0026E4069B|nr:globin family protein [Wenyingzhuangia sp. 2_MG-2023]MDO6737957.1 globin family protein [Wenyingzhuangia sp. 2_MG-2023]MDO6802689.1 globin family protein [Wenyingzhuangia sp. 1_MG-2023]
MSFLSSLFSKKKTVAESIQLLPAETVALVQTSYEAIKPIAATAAKIFYSELFELDPSLKPLFPTSNKTKMKELGNKLTKMLATTITGLSNPEVLIPVLQDLGKRHINYNIEKSHYDTFGSALLRTLAISLGDDFTTETKQAWEDTYGLIASVMIEAAY